MGLRRYLRKIGVLPPKPVQPESEGSPDAPEVDNRGNALFHYYCEFPAEELIAGFALENAPETPGVATNFLGVKIAPEVMPSILTPRVGKTEGLPFPGNWHADIAEWAAALLSVREAKDIYRIVEIGCGWGCWLTNMGFAAKRIGLAVDLIGIEGDRQHLENAKQVLMLNGFNEDEFRLTNGIAAPKEGLALFPLSDRPGEDWGAEPIFFPDPETLSKIRSAGSHSELTCHTLSELSQNEQIDLLHIDIQGAEMDFVEGNYGDVSKYAKRVFIGTHSRFLEGSLQKFFLDRGWTLEMDRPAISEIVDGKPEIRVDGALLFRNPSMSAPKF